MAKDKQNPVNEDGKKKKSKLHVVQPGGLKTDTSLVMQPQQSLRFALNAINETDEGDVGFVSNEEGNQAWFQLPDGFIPIGRTYIGNQETMLFLTNDNGDSMIAIVDREKNLTVQVDDSNQSEKFGFRVGNQIEATYRLRRGCERTVYWVDPIPRTFIIEKPEKFKNPDGTWNIGKFNLFKRYSSIPTFDTVTVENSGGVLKAGSYNFAIQYLDESLNPTEFITSNETAVIYNEDLQSAYKDIRGSSAVSSSYYNASPTSKAIKVVLGNLDTDYPYYKLAIIEANGGSGVISVVNITSEIAIANNTFVYTGLNFETTIAQEEIAVFSDVIESARSITQVENRLLLANTKGKPINLCVLQKYASRIKADCTVKTVLLNKLDNGNSKRGEAHIDGLGYMPGEIYSYGIQYIFEDSNLSPVYHIPGKSLLAGAYSTYKSSSEGKTFYPMSLDNGSDSTFYTDSQGECATESYWGLDAEGQPLLGAPVRHHRFPRRGEIGLPLFSKDDPWDPSDDLTLYAIRVKVSGVYKTCPDVGEPGYDPACVETQINYGVTYTLTDDLGGTEDQEQFYTISSDSWNDDPAVVGQTRYLGPFTEMPTAVTLVEVNDAGVSVPVSLTATSSTVFTNTSPSPTGLTYTIDFEDFVESRRNPVYSTQVLGIEFSGIDIPDINDTNGVKIIGYQIVRQERTEDEKTIIDSAILTPLLENKHFVSAGMMIPELSGGDESKLKKDFLGLINPEFKFRNKAYTNFDEIIQEGTYDKVDTEHSRVIIQNVLGDSTTSSYDPDHNPKSEKDDDGWDLQIRTRDSSVDYTADSKILYRSNNIREVFYLDALSYKTTKDSTDTDKDVYNISCDNKMGILSLETEYTGPSMTLSLPYVLLKKDNKNPYANFRTTSYYKETRNPVYFSDAGSDSTEIFNGDSYIGSMKYVSSMFYENRIRKRKAKSSIIKYIVGAVLVTAGILGAIFSGGASLVLAAAGMAIAGGGVLISSGIRQDTWAKTYGEAYDLGLRETVEDTYVKTWFKNVNPSDDEIRWFADALTNIWFESNVNVSLRQGANVGASIDFINSPASAETGNGDDGAVDATTVLDKHMVSKLTIPNPDRPKSSLEYIGLALPEIYDVNPDYSRRNKQKAFEHLPFEYDCCSDCVETFPHRVMYSEQSFQEELSDNFRVFLPNSYRDIEGETGQIMDMFRIQTNLYIHTEEGLWHLPQNYQERMTGDILSFIGTGGYFDTAPRKIVDDTDSSAGTSHKWGRTKTKHGVLFPSHREKKWYLFDGAKLQPITDTGMTSSFKQDMRFLSEESYYRETGKAYPYADNPSNALGTGYISVYDSKKERLIVTKKDFDLTNKPEGAELCSTGSNSVVFENFNGIIADKEKLGYEYLGLENCKMKFKRITYEPRPNTRIVTTPTTRTVTETRYRTEEVTEEVSIFKDMDYLVFKYNFNEITGGDDLDTRTALTWPISVGPYGFAAASNTNGSQGTIFDMNNYLNWAGDNTGAGVESVMINVKKIKADFPSATQIKFSCAAWWYVFNSGGGIENMDAIAYKGGTMTNIPKGTTGCTYTFDPSVDCLVQGTYSFPDKFIQEAPTGSTGVGPGTPGVSAANTIGEFTLTLDTGDLSWDGLSGGSLPPQTTTVTHEVTTPYDYTYEVTDYTVTPAEDPTLVPVVEIDYVEGDVFNPIQLNNSTTQSFSLKFNSWTSWHSYLPCFYFSVQDTFYAWRGDKKHIYKHGIKGLYQRYFDEDAPFIVEFVENDYPLYTKVTNDIMFQTEAKRYDADLQEYYDLGSETFNKALIYNSRQISGWLLLVNKLIGSDYLENQVKDLNLQIPIARSEKNWTINGFRDYSSPNEVPLFSKNLADRQGAYFIDKVVNPSAIKLDKDWTQLEPFRDKFLVVRLVYDKSTNTRLIFNFSLHNKSISER